MLTDYQSAKKNPPLRLKVINCKYLKGSEIADESLCRIALKHREWLVRNDLSRAKRVFRFLAFVNQSDWRAKQLLAMVDGLGESDEWFNSAINEVERDFAKKIQSVQKRSKICFLRMI